MKDKLGLNFAAEIHAAEFLGGAHIYLGLEAWQRVRAIRWLLKELSREPKLKFVAIGRDKQSGGRFYVLHGRDLSSKQKIAPQRESCS